MGNFILYFSFNNIDAWNQFHINVFSHQKKKNIPVSAIDNEQEWNVILSLLKSNAMVLCMDVQQFKKLGFTHVAFCGDASKSLHPAIQSDMDRL